jgi:hypothetical protein
MTRDIAASVKARLLAQAKARDEEFELALVRYGCERLLYRLGESELRERFVLKGAALLTLWMQDPYRNTRDLDFLAFGPSDPATIKGALETICGVAVFEDGLTFDLDRLEISPIRDEDEYPGQRAVFTAYLGKARIRMQLDFGFGDVVEPGPEKAEFPAMLDDQPAPRLLACPRPVVVAEKFEAMIRLGRRNSRMRDFHDIWALSEAFGFDGAQLRLAIARCFERRGTAWAEELPDPLRETFYQDESLRLRWQYYLRAGGFRAAPPNWDKIGERVRSFLGPIRDHVVRRASFPMSWPASGPWEGTDG